MAKKKRKISLSRMFSSFASFGRFSRCFLSNCDMEGRDVFTASARKRNEALRKKFCAAKRTRCERQFFFFSLPLLLVEERKKKKR